MGSVFLLLSYGAVQVYMRGGLFTTWLPYTLTLAQQGLLISFVPSDLNFQELYSLLHPVLFCGLIVATLRESYCNAIVALLFLALGANWAFFFNDSLWSYDMVELVSLFIFIVSIHSNHFFLVPRVRVFAFILLSTVRFGASTSYHMFSSAAGVTPNTLATAGILPFIIAPYAIFLYTYYTHCIRGLFYAISSYADGYRVRLVPYHA